MRLLIGMRAWTFALLVLGAQTARSQEHRIGFLEKFALAEDRAKVLQELIPGSDDYYYYHCLHHQVTGKLAEAESLLQEWAMKTPPGERWQQLHTRQRILSYGVEPQRTLEYLRNELAVTLDHAPPQADRAKDLATRLDPAILDFDRQLQAALVRDPGLGSIGEAGLIRLMQKNLPIETIRSLLRHTTRVDLPELIPLIEKELQSERSAGWGGIPIHQQLTLEQRIQLAKDMPQLLQHDGFVRQYLLRLLPGDDEASDRPQVRLQHLERLEAFASSLPPSMNSLKALVLYHRLALDFSENRMDRARFERYIKLPRNASYYNAKYLESSTGGSVVDLNATYLAETLLTPIADDSSLVRKYLETFLQKEDSVDAFAAWLERSFLERVWIESKILYGIGQASSWYARLSPPVQSEIKERVELRFANSDQVYLGPNDPVSLKVDVKNVPKLIYRIYHINPRNVYRKQNRAISTDIDLDGLVANFEAVQEYSVPSDRRHRETLDLPQCQGRGVWVVDLLGSGVRSRALVIKGQLQSTEVLTDAGHEFHVYNDEGKLVTDASLEMGNRVFTAEKDGAILVPYGEEDRSTSILLLDGMSATQDTFFHRKETYRLEMGVLLESQNLIGGSKGTLLIRPQVLCQNRPVPNQNLQEVALTLTTTDQDGVMTKQVVRPFELHLDEETPHSFLVPQRLRSVEVQLSGKIVLASRQTQEILETRKTVLVNQTESTLQLSDFFLVQHDRGYTLQLRGRNGEAYGKLPVAIKIQLASLSHPIDVTLATDAQGEIDLGSLDHVESIQCSADRVPSRQFTIHRDSVDWPKQLHVVEGTAVTLPWLHGDHLLGSAELSLLELRSGHVCASWKDRIEKKGNQIVVSKLPPGTYFLTDRVGGNAVEIRVAQGQIDSGFIVGNRQILEVSEYVPVMVTKIEQTKDAIQLQLANVDRFTRVHFVMTPFAIDDATLGRFQAWTYPGLSRKTHSRVLSSFVDSLRLDDEYQYILQRQYATHYPGNLLPQPTLLLNPWDTATSQNQSQMGNLGDAIPPSAAAPRPKSEDALARKREEARAAQLSSSHEFLRLPAVVMANVQPDERGRVVLSRDRIQNVSSVTAIVVHPSGVTCKTVTLPKTEIPTTDLRLQKAFDGDKHLAQKKWSKVLEGGKQNDLGDARTTRIQVYASLADVYRLYSTLLPSSELTKFERISRWHELKEEEKRKAYNELACHELHLFLYRKDRPFFDSVVRPFLEDKLAPQVVDQWLLQKDLKRYRNHWDLSQLNVVEQILLANRLPEAKAGIQKRFQDLWALQKSQFTDENQFATALASLSLDLGRIDELSANPSRFDDYALRFQEEKLAENSPGVPGADKADKKWAYGANRNEMEGRALGMGTGGDPAALAEGRKGKPQAGDRMGGVESSSGGLGGMGGGGFGGGRGSERSRRSITGNLLFTQLDATREWAESNYYRIPLKQQNAELVTVNPFWIDFMDRDPNQGVLSTQFHLAATNANAAIMALAMLDLPLESVPYQLEIRDGRWTAKSDKPIVVYIESIEETRKEEQIANLMAGQEVYVVDSGDHSDPQKPVTNQSWVQGKAYRTSVVVTNPTGEQRVAKVLTQVPQGAIPLQGGKVVQTKIVPLGPYTTQQIEYYFYFPKSGEFDHYGSQVAVEGTYAASIASQKRKVLEKPEEIDTGSWDYIADWGTNDQVLSYLKTQNVQGLDLDRIAFRMQDRGFFEAALTVLSEQVVYEPSLWAYGLLHGHAQRIREFLAFEESLENRLGPVLRTELCNYDTADRYDYQHLDYRPLVVARSHMLGQHRVILNESLATQYNLLLERLAFQPQIQSADRMALTYYLLLQNRIQEALAHFALVDRNGLAMEIQYDYLQAYLDFYQSQYDHAQKIAEKYLQYPVPRWRELFAKVDEQVRQRQQMVKGLGGDEKVVASEVVDPVQRLLIDARQSQHAAAASQSPALDLTSLDGKLVIHHQNIEEVEVRFYLMDIELLFSRNPFVQPNDRSMMAIQPNRVDRIALGKAKGKRSLELPADMAHRNVVVEVSSGALIKSHFYYANTIEVTMVDAFGMLQVTSRDGKPIEKAYVKVYARHQDGQVKFYKDGYTDLRGQFDYASLSTADLQSTQRFSILIMHPELGSIIQEVAPPKR